MPTTFQNRPVFDIVSLRPNWDEITHGQIDDTGFEAEGLGRETPWKSTTKVKRKARANFLIPDRASVTALRQWIIARGTRRDAFWFPLFLNDYGLTQNAAQAATQIRIKNIGLAEKYQYGRQFRFLALLTPDKLECYEIRLIEEDGETELITLTSGLTTALDAEKTCCCGLMLSRFSDDEIEFQMLTDGVARIGINVVELPQEVDVTSATSAPLYLYRLTRGESLWYFTNWPQAVEAEALTWEPLDVDHGDFKQDSEFSLDPLRLSVATDDPESPFRTALDRNISEVTEMEIFETDFSTLTVDLDEPVYKGRIGLTPFREHGRIDINLSTLFRIGEQKVPTVPIQRPCHNRLFDEFCALAAGDFDTLGVVASMSDDPPWIEATAFGDKATAEADPDWFALGRVVVGNEVRLCVGQSGNRLYLNNRYRAATIGDSVTAYPGCDKRLSTCEAKFDNVVNYLGFPLMPNRNPQLERLVSPVPSGGKKNG